MSCSNLFLLALKSCIALSNSTAAEAQGATATIYRDSTNLSTGGSGWMVRTYRIGAVSIQTSASMSSLDSPNSTSQLTYKCYVAATYGGTAQWNSGDNDAATITVYEIAG